MAQTVDRDLHCHDSHAEPSRQGNGDDQANAVAVDRSGNVVVSGSSWNGNLLGHRDYYLAKYAAADGGLLWEKRYGQGE